METLPPEVIEAISAFLAPSTIASLSLVSKTLHYPAQHALYKTPTLYSIRAFHALLSALESDRKQARGAALSGSRGATAPTAWSREVVTLGDAVQEVVIRCREVGTPRTNGWGACVGRLLNLSKHVKTLDIQGVEDLRIRHLSGSGALRTLSLSAVTFRANSLPVSPHLASTLSSVSHLTLVNLGLPTTTHLPHILSSCTGLRFLSISFLRDTTAPLFHEALSSVSSTLVQLQVGTLTEAQIEIFFPTVLHKLKSLRKLILTVPLPSTSEQYRAIPDWVEDLELRQGRIQNLEQEFEAVEGLARELNAGVAAGLKEVALWDTEWGRKGVSDAARMRNIKVRFGEE